MLELTQVARLDVSAASGLVALAGRFYVIADDEAFLAAYTADGAPLGRVALVPDALPPAHAERKRRKPDFEALALLPDGRLLALGSGSTDARMRGVVVSAQPGAAARVIDLAPLYARLSTEISDLNVEGATVAGERLVLLQRGNGPARFNACIELDFGRVLEGLDARGALDAAAVRAITPVALGDIDGVPLSFTDAVSRPDGAIVFSAAAEDAADAYHDGPCAGSVVGVLSEGRVTRSVRLSPRHKIEGIAVLAASDAPDAPDALWCVADADDREVPANLYRAPFPFT
jgi:hypothetical protein